MRFSEFKPLNELANLSVPDINNTQDIETLQRILSGFEFDISTSGIIDDRTKNALSLIQKDAGIPVTGMPDPDTIKAINVALLGAPDVAKLLDPSVKSNQKVNKAQSDLPVSNDLVSIEKSLPLSNKLAHAEGRSVIIGNQKRTGGSISWRTNNPGNVAYGPKAKSFGALGFIKASDGEPVAIMPTLDHGWNLQMALWRTPRYNNGTIEQGCKTWATGVRYYKGTSPYTITLAKAADASIHTKVSDLSNNQLKNMIMAQAKLEGFKAGTITTV